MTKRNRADGIILSYGRDSYRLVQLGNIFNKKKKFWVKPIEKGSRTVREDVKNMQIQEFPWHVHVPLVELRFLKKAGGKQRVCTMLMELKQRG